MYEQSRWKSQQKMAVKRNLIRSLQQLVPLVISVNHDKVKESPKNETAHAPNCSDATQADAAQDNANTS